MFLIDTHTHIYLPEFDTDRDEAVERSVSNGVVKMLMPNIDVNSVNSMLSAEERYRNICLPMIGLHPTSVKEDYLQQLDILEKLFEEHKFIAIGEIGIDLYWDKTFLKEQMIALRRQISFALKKELPVVIHSRESFPEVFSVLEEFRGKGLKGVLHAFTGTIEDAEKALDLGFKLGIGGIVTFKNSGLDKVVKEIGPENLILETDSPYLAPVPYRGKRNESSYICIINKKLAEIFGKSEKEVAAITFATSADLFKI
ncbi:MAG: TatD family hydrolase [Bacteroidales bacterium]|nr:TatD family hydrolase [Bacteroidales bacterium]MBK7628951.1 TatD family hydrolase [Bacteroidales bacterium]